MIDLLQSIVSVVSVALCIAMVVMFIPTYKIITTLNFAARNEIKPLTEAHKPNNVDTGAVSFTRNYLTNAIYLLHKKCRTN